MRGSREVRAETPLLPDPPFNRVWLKPPQHRMELKNDGEELFAPVYGEATFKRPACQGCEYPLSSIRFLGMLDCSSRTRIDLVKWHALAPR